MEKNEKIEIAAKLLSESCHHVSNRKNESDDCCFDFVVSDDSTEIDVFRAGSNRDSFHWADVVVRIANGLGLGCYIHRRKINFGADKYGCAVEREVICMQVYA